MAKTRSLLCLVLLVLSVPVLAETRYVTDELTIMMRRGQGTEFAILAQLKSGTPLEVLERDQGYVRVRTPKGNEGWVIERYLVEQPVARERLAQAQTGLAAAQARATEAVERADALAQEAERLRAERDALSAERDTVAAQLAEVQTAAAQTLQIRAENGELAARVAELEAELARLDHTDEGQRMRRDFLLLGAAVLFVGVLVGLLAPHLGRRRSSDW